jgi:hypothetical protein
MKRQNEMPAVALMVAAAFAFSGSGNAIDADQTAMQRATRPSSV